ncbi:MAG: hypothetical protein AAFS10_17760 [Myxococcota bacterium]
MVLTTILLFLLLQKPEIKYLPEQKAASTQVDEKKKKGKWEDKEDNAIALVLETMIPNPAAKKPRPKKRYGPPPEELPAKITLKELVDRKFFEKTFKLDKLGHVGWEARFLKRSYYFVTYAHRDELVNVGPTWLVDVKRNRVIAKNAMAEAAMNPSKTDAQEFFEHEQQVVSAISNHRFQTGGISLGGSMLIYFSKLAEKTSMTDKDTEDKILGWTIAHHYGDIYQAYFQWTESGESTYAEFEFNYAEKALRSKNLQAANLMQFGQDFEATERVSILPLSYNPDATRASDRWTGSARRACTSPTHRTRCRVMAKIYQNRELIEAVEWLLTSTAKTAADFESCKKNRHCCWKASEADDGTYRVVYGYDLDAEPSKPAGACSAADGKTTVSWFVNPKSNAIVPENSLSDMAYRAVRPRSQISL